MKKSEIQENMKNNLIPRLEDMIDKEEKHLEYLKEEKEKFSQINIFNSIFKLFNTFDIEDIENMIKVAEKNINHLKGRLKGYTEYSEEKE